MMWRVLSAWPFARYDIDTNFEQPSLYIELNGIL